MALQHILFHKEHHQLPLLPTKLAMKVKFLFADPTIGANAKCVAKHKFEKQKAPVGRISTVQQDWGRRFQECGGRTASGMPIQMQLF